MKEETAAADPGRHADQIQESTRPSTTPIGTAGAAGWPEHQAPAHGREGAGTESGSARPDRSKITGSINEEKCPESVLDLTRCEHPARTGEGADRTSAKSERKAPAGSKTGCR
jgi:hypothetical protein